MGDNRTWLMFLGAVIVAFAIMGAAGLTLITALVLARRRFLILGCGALGGLAAGGLVAARFLPDWVSHGAVGGGPLPILIAMVLTMLSAGFLAGTAVGGLLSWLLSYRSADDRFV